MVDDSIFRDGVLELGALLDHLVGLCQHLGAVLLCHLLTCLVDRWVEGVALELLIVLALPLRFRGQPVSLQEIEVLLQLPALLLIECKLLVRIRLLSLLEVDWVDVEDADQGEEEYAYVFGIYLEFL